MKSLRMKKQCSKFCFNFKPKLNRIPLGAMWSYVTEGIIKIYVGTPKVPTTSHFFHLLH